MMSSSTRLNLHFSCTTQISVVLPIRHTLRKSSKPACCFEIKMRAHIGSLPPQKNLLPNHIGNGTGTAGQRGCSLRYVNASHRVVSS